MGFPTTKIHLPRALYASALFAILILLPQGIAHAATGGSGACSSHGGVDCSAGADWDGSVICEDGWSNSIVDYDDVIECEDSGLKCPIYLSQSSYDSLQKTYSDSIARLEADTEAMCQSFYITDVDSVNRSYDLCLSSIRVYQGLGSFPTGIDCDGDKNRGLASASSKKESCLRSDDLNVQKYRTLAACTLLDKTTSCPINSIAIGSSCICSTGYVMRNNQCVTYTAACEAQYGPNLYGVAGTESGSASCRCNSGYQWNSGQTACSAIPQSIPVPTITSASKLPDTIAPINPNAAIKAADLVRPISIDADKDLPTASQVKNCQSGTLVRGTLPAVYFCGADGKRYVFPNSRTYDSWYTNFDGVAQISDEKLASIPLGGNVTYRPGIRMIKIQTDPKVYAVAKNGTLRWITSEAVARDLYGDRWNQYVDDVSDAFFTNYKIGEPISQ